ncbi:hypothetical protein [Cesiribacter andamanensis]|uniref:Uncharacterized protein n=1 Tax=Cesiribacter andamanensis AMV16 TaxID=1279009 RepID=M7N9R1_9BACT|nr:hypothetical protein [Cesiribacter andamanensis]EMR04007.1 hypothetical protein ADICEAN_00878 [Cesiribacter andamanensis AMV16]
MYPAHTWKAFLLMAALSLAAVTGWEWYCRYSGKELSYPNSKGFWAQQRRLLADDPTATVIIGSSRVQFGIDLDTWAQEMGRRPVQLSMEGSSPLPILSHLAQDPAFRGSLLVGVTPNLFFSPEQSRGGQKAAKLVAHYLQESPSQRLGNALNLALESRLVFLDEDQLGLDRFLEFVELPNREGVMTMPQWPYHFTTLTKHRQRNMSQAFLNSRQAQLQQLAVWRTFMGWEKQAPVLAGEGLARLFEQIRQDTEAIRSRGGRVLFVRMPSTGSYLAFEDARYPREAYWDQLLAKTGCKGYYFSDYPALSGFDCPEESHLTPADAKRFTRSLAEIIRSDKLPPIIVASKAQAP